jgi:hypothetical protein
VVGDLVEGVKDHEEVVSYQFSVVRLAFEYPEDASPPGAAKRRKK